MIDATSIFLLPNATFVVELAVVGVILFLMTKYILPPLNREMEKRQAKIRASLEAAEAARAEASAASDERARVLSEAREQARTIVAGAQATSDQLKAESGARAQAEYARIVATAQSEVDVVRQRAIDDASTQIGDVVYALVEKIVEREVDRASHDDLVREAVAALHAEVARGTNR